MQREYIEVERLMKYCELLVVGLFCHGFLSYNLEEIYGILLQEIWFILNVKTNADMKSKRNKGIGVKV